MSGSVGTTRAGSNRHSGMKEKANKTERNTSQQQSSQTTVKSETLSKLQPTQEQMIMAQIINTNQPDADPKTKKLVTELMELTGKSEDVVVIALHDAENDADRAVNMLLEGGDKQQGEWREQGGKRKKKVSTQKDGSNHIGDDNFEGRNKDKGDRDEKDQDGGVERYDAPPRRGRRNGGPPPRLARGRGRERGNFGDREGKDKNTEEWDNDRGDENRDRSGSDRGRPRGRGFGSKRGGGSGRGRFNNSTDRDNRSFNRVPRFEKNNSQPVEGPEIDTWTNETAETNTSKDTDWDNWNNDTWVNEDDQWTGTLEETKVFTPSQMKIPEPEPVLSEAPSSLGQRLDVGSLFIESAKFSKAPDYSKPTGDAYITQFNQAATESIKNTIGIGSSSRPPVSLNSLTMPQQSSSNTLGLSSLSQSTGHGQGGAGVLANLSQQGSQSSMSQTITQLSQISQSASQGISQIGLSSQQQSNRDQVPPVQSRIPSVMQQQQQNMSIPTSMSASLQQRPKPQRSKLPPPSKIPASAVEMPGHIPRNPQLDLQFGIDFSSESFGFNSSNDDVEVSNTYTSSTSNGSSVISNHLGQAHVSKSSDGSSMVSNLKSSPSAGSNKGLTTMESQQSTRQSTVFHNSVYTASPPKNENPSLDREQNKLEHKSSPMMSQRSGQINQKLNTGSLPQNKTETSSYPTANGYSPPYQTHQKASSISQTQTYTHTTNSQPPQGSTFQGQYPASQSSYPSSGQNQFAAPPNSSQFPPAGQPPQYNNSQSQYSSGQAQFASSGATNHPPIPHSNHQSQYSAGAQNSYTTGGQSQYSGYQNNSSFPSHPPSQPNYPTSNQTGGPSSSLYPVATQTSGSSYSQSSSYQSPSAGSYHREGQQNVPATTQSSTGVTFSTASQSVTLKAASSQTNTNYNSQSFTATPAPLQPSTLVANKLGESLSKMTLKDTSTLDSHQSVQYDNSNASTTVSTSLSIPASTTSASLSTGTTTISSTSTATSITSTSRITSMPSTSKAPPNLPPGVPLMGQYIMGQSTMPPFYSMQPPLYGYEADMQLLQQRMPVQTGSYYDLGAFPAPGGSALPTGRDQQQPLTTFSGTSADTNKMARVDAQSPNSTSQPQNAHSAQQPLINFHYGYYYPSMFPGAASIQYPTVFPIPPVTNAAAHAGTTPSQFQKTYASHVYTTKGYDELNQAQDFSKTGYGSSSSTGKSAGTSPFSGAGTSEITPNAYNKTHTQAFDKQGYHGGTPPPFSLPLATATQAGPMGAPTTPYGAPFLPVMAAHQAHSQMMHHPIQQDTNSSTSRGLNQQGNQTKAGGAKSYGAPQYWNN